MQPLTVCGMTPRGVKLTGSCAGFQGPWHARSPGCFRIGRSTTDSSGHARMDDEDRWAQMLRAVTTERASQPGRISELCVAMLGLRRRRVDGHHRRHARPQPETYRRRARRGAPRPSRRPATPASPGRCRRYSAFKALFVTGSATLNALRYWQYLARLDRSGPCAPSPLVTSARGGEPDDTIPIRGNRRRAPTRLRGPSL